MIKKPALKYQLTHRFRSIIRLKALIVGRIKEWRRTKHPHPDEFHQSYQIDRNYVIALPNWRERSVYMMGIWRRRSDAHRRTLD